MDKLKEVEKPGKLANDLNGYKKKNKLDLPGLSPEVVGGNVIDELIKGLITVKEESLLVLIIFFLLGSVIGLIIAWFRRRPGALITITCSIAAGLTWGFDDLTLFSIILIPMISGILILLSAYQKDDKAPS